MNGAEKGTAEFKSFEASYYKKKAGLDFISSLINKVVKANEAAKLEVIKAKLSAEISERDKRSYQEKIFQINESKNPAGEKDERYIETALRSMEEELEANMKEIKANNRKLGTQATDDDNRDMLYAISEYNYVSDLLGNDSPAKVAKRAAKQAAKREAAII